jgi:hypothetical protein
MSFSLSPFEAMLDFQRALDHPGRIRAGDDGSA